MKAVFILLASSCSDISSRPSTFYLIDYGPIGRFHSSKAFNFVPPGLWISFLCVVNVGHIVFRFALFSFSIDNISVIFKPVRFWTVGESFLSFFNKCIRGDTLRFPLKDLDILSGKADRQVAAMGGGNKGREVFGHIRYSVVAFPADSEGT